MIGSLIMKKKVSTPFELLNQGKLDELMADWSEDAVLIFPGNANVSGVFKGKYAIRDWFGTFIEQFPVRKFTIKRVCVEKIFSFGATNSACIEWELYLENKDGKEFTNFGTTAIEVVNGKVVAAREYLRFTDNLKEGWGEE